MCIRDRSQVIPICLPWKDGDPTVENLLQKTPNQYLVITGWGRLTNNIYKVLKNYKKFGVAARTLQKVSLPIQTNKECKKTYRNLHEASSFCIGGLKGDFSKFLNT